MRLHKNEKFSENLPSYEIFFLNSGLTIKKFDWHKITCHSAKNVFLIVEKNFKVKSGGHRQSLWCNFLMLPCFEGANGGCPHKIFNSFLFQKLLDTYG